MNFKRFVTKAVGYLNIAMSFAGLVLCLKTAQLQLRSSSRIPEGFAAASTYFTTTVLLLLFLLLSGVMLAIGRGWAARLALLVYAAEVLYIFLGQHVPWGPWVVWSVGMAPQMFCLYPVWAGALVWWSTRATTNSKTNDLGQANGSHIPNT